MQFKEIFFLKWTILGLFFFIFVFSIQLTVNVRYILIANGWVRTADLWNCKQSLYQLSHNHCPKRDILYRLKLYLFNSQSQAFDLYIRSLALKDFFEQKFLPFFFFVISPSLSLIPSNILFVSDFVCHSNK